MIVYSLLNYHFTQFNQFKKSYKTPNKWLALYSFAKLYSHRFVCYWCLVCAILYQLLYWLVDVALVSAVIRSHHTSYWVSVSMRVTGRVLILLTLLWSQGHISMNICLVILYYMSNWRQQTYLGVGEWFECIYFHVRSNFVQNKKDIRPSTNFSGSKNNCKSLMVKIFCIIFQDRIG